MTSSRVNTIVDSEGIVGTIVDEAGAPPPDAARSDEAAVAIEFANGRRALVPRSVLLLQDDGRYYLPMSLAAMAAATAEQSAGETVVIPVIEEQAKIDKRRVVTGQVRVTKRVHQTETVVDEPLIRERVDVRRVPIGTWVDGPVAVRQEGDTTILPLLEEVLVVEKRLRLVEEVHITRHREDVRRPETVTLRREDVVVEPADRLKPAKVEAG